MPCDQITTFRATFEHVKDLDRLAKAAKLAGWSVTQQGEFLTLYRGGVTFQLRKLGDGVTGEAVGSRLSPEDVASLKSELMKGYAAETVKVAAQKFGWKVKDRGQAKLTLERR